LDEFERLLLQAIDETIRYCLGDINAQIFYNYLEKKDCPIQEIPKKLDVFVMELENLVGLGRGQILGPAQILKKEILKAFCAKLGINYEVGPDYLPEQIRKLKEIYSQRKPKTSTT
jgi:hypothetical protein